MHGRGVSNTVVLVTASLGSLGASIGSTPPLKQTIRHRIAGIRHKLDCQCGVQTGVTLTTQATQDYARDSIVRRLVQKACVTILTNGLVSLFPCANTDHVGRLEKARQRALPTIQVSNG